MASCAAPIHQRITAACACPHEIGPLAANGGSDAEVMGENFSSSGRSNERFAGLMEKIRFPSGYLLFEIWKSGAKKRERRRRRKHDGREKRGKIVIC